MLHASFEKGLVPSLRSTDNSIISFTLVCLYLRFHVPQILDKLSTQDIILKSWNASHYQPLEL